MFSSHFSKSNERTMYACDLKVQRLVLVSLPLSIFSLLLTLDLFLVVYGINEMSKTFIHF